MGKSQIEGETRTQCFQPGDDRTVVHGGTGELIRYQDLLNQ